MPQAPQGLPGGGPMLGRPVPEPWSEGEPDVRQNLYRIDDVLLRCGIFALLAVIAGAAALVVVGLAQDGGAGASDPGLAMLQRHAFALAVAIPAPIGLLAAGFRMRRREQKTLAFWRLLQQNAEIRVPELLASSDFSRADLERAVRLLNNQGLALYVWDRDADLIRDGRLESVYLHVEKCDVCRASISLRVPASLREIPCCPYCGDVISIESLLELKREALERLRAEHRPRERERGHGVEAGSFSIVVFLLLLFTFWPAALVYGWYKWQAGTYRPGTE